MLRAVCGLSLRGGALFITFWAFIVSACIVAFVIPVCFILWQCGWVAQELFKKIRGSPTSFCEHLTSSICAAQCATYHELAHSTAEDQVEAPDTVCAALSVPEPVDATAAAPCEADILLALSNDAWTLLQGDFTPDQEQRIAYLWLWHHSLPLLFDAVAAGLVQRVLGAGGMGVVYDVDDIPLPLGQGSVSAVQKVAQLSADDLASPEALAAKQQGTQAEICVHLAAASCCNMVPRLYAGDAMCCTLLVERCAGKDLHTWMNLCMQNNSDAHSLHQHPNLHLIQVAHSLLLAADQLQQGGVVHRDIKLDNVMYEPATGQLKLLDLGLGALLGADGTCHSGIVGTPGFVAPEVRAQHSAGLGLQVRYTAKVDTYAIGVLLVWWAVPQAAPELSRCEVHPRALLPHIRSKRGSRLAELVEGLLEKAPERRLSAQDALAYPLFAGVANRTPQDVAAGFLSLISVEQPAM